MQAQTHNDTSTLDILVFLLRGEISALESYQRVLERVDGYPEDPRLRLIYGDHSHAVQVLRNLLSHYQPSSSRIARARGDTLRDLGPSAAHVLDDRSALLALKEAEERMLRDYRRVLMAPELGLPVKAMIRSDLLRKNETHVPVLDALLERLLPEDPPVAVASP